MPTNLSKQYNSLLDFLYHSFSENIASFKRIFDRDIRNASSFLLQDIPIQPTTSVNGEDAMDRLFRHLTTVVVDEKTKKRDFESERTIRLHWLKYHIDTCVGNNCLLFNVPSERRIYLLDKAEKYVIVFEPLRNMRSLYLLTAYHMGQSQYKRLMNKYDKRGEGGTGL